MASLPSASGLPVEGVLPALRDCLALDECAVLRAETGAGKTTRVPLSLMNEPWLAGRRILMLEPRRLAAIRAASYMARLLGEEAGASVGYRIRGESRVGPRTRVEVLTEGILTRMIQEDRCLSGTGAVIFDEFHERSIHADLGLALSLAVRGRERPDLRILVMSATLRGEPLADLMGGARMLDCPGRLFPVEIHYERVPPPPEVESLVAKKIRTALREKEGDLLVFLPGRREIERVRGLLEEEGGRELFRICILHGAMDPSLQQDALAPAPAGVRKVVLSTSVAETSLTIEGIRVVIDSGLSRISRFDPRRGMAGLVTVPVSRASAEQRAGRAGRLAPGVCYRLWTEAEHALHPDAHPPEIMQADLAVLALETACWEGGGGGELRFPDAPSPAQLARARELLSELGALDHTGGITSDGRAMARIAAHPRLARMLMQAAPAGLGPLACDVAALLSDRDILPGGMERDIDLVTRLELLSSGGEDRRAPLHRVREESRRLRRLMGVGDTPQSPHQAGFLLAFAYPDRIAGRMGGRMRLSGGPEVLLPRGSPLERSAFLAVPEVDGAGRRVKAFLAASLEEADLRSALAGRITCADEIAWIESEQRVAARRVERLGSLILSESPLGAGAPGVVGELLAAVRRRGLTCLPWTAAAREVRARSEWARARISGGLSWPDLSEETLLSSLGEWLTPHCPGFTRLAQLQGLDLHAILRARLGAARLKEMDRTAPPKIRLPSGVLAPVGYETGRPVLSVRLQQMLGQTETPTVGGERVLIQLLSPSGRPLAVTRDLKSFWAGAYPGVRKEMRGRYPKHFWPEDPLRAAPPVRKGTR
ncbi:MAG: ATP-dependent helicase HrpB [Bacteroidota bacterium]